MAAEIEVLVKVEDNLDQLVDFLNQEATYKEERVVQDIYYYDPLRQNLQPDHAGKLSESLRVRNEEGVFSLTHKTDFFDESGRWTYSEESETTVSSYADTMAILSSLGLKQLTRVDARKRYYHYLDYEIAVENVDRLGAFLEVEFKGEVSGDHMAIKDQIESFVRGLPCKTSRDFDGGKPELMISRFGIDQGAN